MLTYKLLIFKIKVPVQRFDSKFCGGKQKYGRMVGQRNSYAALKSPGYLEVGAVAMARLPLLRL